MIGAGTWATALALNLHRTGYTISAIISRDGSGSLMRARKLAKRVNARWMSLSKVQFAANITWICVPDDAIASVVQRLLTRTSWTGKFVVHSSGALGAEVLRPLRDAGACTASAHPLMTFVSASETALTDVPFALEGDARCLSVIAALVRDMEAKPFRIGSQFKPAYHAFGFFSSPAIVTLLAAAQQVGSLAGLSSATARKLMEPIVRQTIENCFRLDPPAAFSGPLKRGDAATVRKHLEVLKQRPELLNLYKALAQIAVQELPVTNMEKLKTILNTTT